MSYFRSRRHRYSFELGKNFGCRTMIDAMQVVKVPCLAISLSRRSNSLFAHLVLLHLSWAMLATLCFNLGQWIYNLLVRLSAKVSKTKIWNDVRPWSTLKLALSNLEWVQTTPNMPARFSIELVVLMSRENYTFMMIGDKL